MVEVHALGRSRASRPPIGNHELTRIISVRNSHRWNHQLQLLSDLSRVPDRKRPRIHEIEYIDVRI